MKITVFAFLLAAALPAVAGGFGPWSFGMTADQIRAVTASGPYRSFSNGDLETYNGEFGGKKENVQFFLKDSLLARVGVYTYEGTDLSAATQAWAHTYSTLQAEYGQIETPNYQGQTAETLGKAAGAIVAAGGKAQMAPVVQPKDAFVFSSFASYAHDGITYYTVTVNYDQPAP
ncbi:hypothetical protein [Rhodanobacter sp. C01]|uniref:hypothetical protein n=1 Tax=Rhodanobacter sp. C01 TaxID=1945856 RepID=UPI000987BDD4|nr:hypothetical protein [Rhodanobacter sp. C01]OOG45629.1 hypothetical protein B0E50_15670 [Rhodanobacter sp. C01]